MKKIFPILLIIFPILLFVTLIAVDYSVNKVNLYYSNDSFIQIYKRKSYFVGESIPITSLDGSTTVFAKKRSPLSKGIMPSFGYLSAHMLYESDLRPVVYCKHRTHILATLAYTEELFDNNFEKRVYLEKYGDYKNVSAYILHQLFEREGKMFHNEDIIWLDKEDKFCGSFHYSPSPLYVTKPTNEGRKFYNFINNFFADYINRSSMENIAKNRDLDTFFVDDLKKYMEVYSN